jgi:hypothetical protein
MSSRQALRWLSAALLSLSHCKCQDTVRRIQPQIRIDATSVDFGPTLVGGSASQNLVMVAETLQAVTIVKVDILGNDAAAFLVVQPPAQIPGNGQALLSLQFKPTQKRVYNASVQIQSDDYRESDRVKSVALTGEGALPEIQLLPACNAPCANRTVVVTPPSIDYGLEPAFRAVEPKENTWPAVFVRNNGKWPLSVTAIKVQGSDPDRFLPTASIRLDQPLSVDPGGAQVLYIKFAPCGFDNNGQRLPCPATPKTSLSASFVVENSDPSKPRASVALTGSLRPIEPLNVCASIVKVIPAGEAEKIVTWKAPIAVGPATALTLSGFSDYYTNPTGTVPDSLTKCSTDPVDGRTVLGFQWTVVTKPLESRAVIPSANKPNVAFTPDATGSYRLRLTVTKNPPGLTGSDDIAFDAIPQKDLAVQLVWTAMDVDLDLHLTKPGTATCPPPDGTGVTCEPFDKCCDQSAFGKRHFGWPGPDWGKPNDPTDDPRSEFDATGTATTGSLENVNLNFPEHDPACQTSTIGSGKCVYQVWVHYFADARQPPTPPACSGSGCLEGGQCNCAQPSSPDGGSGSRMLCVSNQCRQSPTAAIKVYLQSNPTPALQIPLPANPNGAVAVPGPCFLWHAADIEWPSPTEIAAGTKPVARAVLDGTGNPIFAYYGNLPSAQFSCAPNTTIGTDPWYMRNTSGPPSYP